MSTTDNAVTKLIDDYRRIQNALDNQPDWAVHKRTNPSELVRCTIPFVGKDYFLQAKKILVYASAENLSTYDQKHIDHWEGSWLDIDEQAENRHRKCFDEFDQDAFFPHVHISPMNNGYLSTAVYYLAHKLELAKDSCPRQFYETISIANYGKYSLKTEQQRAERLNVTGESLSKRNIDYANNRDLLEASHPFIKADVDILKPDIIILPISVYKADRKFLDSIKENARVIPIYQMNAGVINRTISGIVNRKTDPKPRFSRYTPEDLPAPIRNWYNQLKQGGTTDNYLSVFTYLDVQLKKFLSDNP